MKFQPSCRKYDAFRRFQRWAYHFGQYSVNFHDTSRYNKIDFTQLVVSGHYASCFGIFGIAFVTASQQCRSFFLSVYHSMVILGVFLGIASHRKWCILSTFKVFWTSAPSKISFWEPLPQTVTPANLLIQLHQLYCAVKRKVYPHCARTFRERSISLDVIRNNIPGRTWKLGAQL